MKSVTDMENQIIFYGGSPFANNEKNDSFSITVRKNLIGVNVSVSVRW